MAVAAVGEKSAQTDAVKSTHDEGDAASFGAGFEVLPLGA
jgi:hypothetical protein